MVTHSSILSWESHGESSLVGCSAWGHKELDMNEHSNNIRTVKCKNFWKLLSLGLS